MKDTFARLISNIFNPFIVSSVILSLLTFEATTEIDDAVKLIFIMLAISIAPVVILVYILVRLKKLDGFFNNPREQRNIIYLISSILGAIDCALLWYLEAPELLAVMFTTGFIAVVIFMIINHFWKISLHTAFITASAVVLILIYGAGAAWTLFVLPLVGWSRVVLKQHTLMQVIAGGLASAAIVLVVFWGFGLVGKS
jgi:membrane-associated phospholipid phosphatase